MNILDTMGKILEINSVLKQVKQKGERRHEEANIFAGIVSITQAYFNQSKNESCSN